MSLLSSGTAWLLVGLIVSLIICADHKQTHCFDLDNGIGLFETSATLACVRVRVRVRVRACMCFVVVAVVLFCCFVFN